jgi:hypothetical protein
MVPVALVPTQSVGTRFEMVPVALVPTLRVGTTSSTLCVVVPVALVPTLGVGTRDITDSPRPEGERFPYDPFEIRRGA